MNAINGQSPQAEQSGGSETDEAEMQGASRMLNDGKGRMCMSHFNVIVWWRYAGPGGL
jgi:hypothetical protein